MTLIFRKSSFADFLRFVFGMLMIAVLSACGGGGGSAGSSSSQLSGGGTTSSTTSSTVAPSPTLTMTVVDGTGTTTNSLSGGAKGTIRATFRDGSGAVLPNAIVTFQASNTSLVDFTPSSASALTDSSGVAVLGVQPHDLNSAGAVAVAATAVLGSKTATSTVNIAIGAAPLVVGSLSFTPAQTAGSSLPAFSTITLNIPITSNGQAVSTVSGLSATSLCVGDGLATIVLGTMSNGVQSATYTNKGCNRGTDTITASVGNSLASTTLAVDPANIGTIQFIGTDLSGQSIVLKGSGGQGRKEAAVVTFKLVDQNNTGLAGVNVSFAPTTTAGGLTVLPTNGTTDATGTVTTTVSSGTIPTPVRVIASASRNGKTISGVSDALTISTGLPIQKSMSMSADKYNIEGGNYDGMTATVTVRLADQYGNKIADGTTVNFITEGGAVGTASQGACTTSDGGCSVPLVSQNFRPTNGRVTVLAYVLGIEDFVDSNGDGQYSCTTWHTPAGATATTIYRPLVDVCDSGGEPFTDQGDPFLDTGNHSVVSTNKVTSQNTLDGTYTAANGDLPVPFNGTTFQVSGDGHFGLNYIRTAQEFTFSGSDATLIRQTPDNCTSNCTDWDTGTMGSQYIITGVAGAGCTDKQITFRLTDSNNNPLPFNTTVALADSSKLNAGTFFPAKVPSTSQVGGTQHSVTIKADSSCAQGYVVIQMTTPNGLGTAYRFTSQ